MIEKPKRKRKNSDLTSEDKQIIKGGLAGIAVLVSMILLGIQLRQSAPELAPFLDFLASAMLSGFLIGMSLPIAVLLFSLIRGD